MWKSPHISFLSLLQTRKSFQRHENILSGGCLSSWSQTQDKQRTRRKSVRRASGQGKVWACTCTKKYSPLCEPSPLRSLDYEGGKYLNLLWPACRPSSPVRRTKRRNMAPLSWSPAGWITAVEALGRVKAQLAQGHWARETLKTGGGGREAVERETAPARRKQHSEGSLLPQVRWYR